MVEWDFVKALLKKMGFHPKWIQWVIQCISTVNFSVVVNGEARVQINPGRGLWQGDPLSPYLFVLVKDLLSKMISTTQGGNNLAGIQFYRHCPKQSHIFFADDALLFLMVEIHNCATVKQLMGKYGQALGQRINFDKSSVTFSSNMGEIDKQLVCDLLEVQLMKGDARYLRLPSFWGRSKTEAYSFIVDKTLGKLQGWKQKQMSQGGKEIMLKFVTQAIPSYAMSCFLLPKGLCDKVNTYVSNFWWKGDPEARGIHWYSWDKMSKSKKDGGMGFRNFRAMKEALLARQG
ncbi:hypothetical protein RHGRI_001466 [Rhododendron griersonianum]|uniref:Reverse transcriptase domain-containing protein n=1 Tax=Rhododendron griersonianum TaxID=479676 RepID=A0AAV6LMT4_9ERIC|nr:hypothetical protein RHGRI_001466 [Rhododendron griersonianum]